MKNNESIVSKSKINIEKNMNVKINDIPLRIVKEDLTDEFINKINENEWNQKIDDNRILCYLSLLYKNKNYIKMTNIYLIISSCFLF